MQIQSVNYQPNFRGNLIGKGITLLKDSNCRIKPGMDKYAYLKIPDNLIIKMKDMVKEKPYDIFISKNKNNPEFVNIDAGYSFENVKKGQQGKIKVRRDTLEALPIAIKDAIECFEGSEINKFLESNLYARK